MQLTIFTKILTFIIFVAAVNGSTEAEDLGSLEIAPELTKALESGDLKLLEPEPGYQPPSPTLRNPPVYPFRQQRKSQGGIVEIVFMVSEKGTTFSAMVVDSTHPEFEPAAIEAVNNYLYEPATVNGKPVDSVSEIRIMFAMRDSKDAATPRYSRLYRRAKASLSSDNPDRQKIRKTLDNMADEDFLSNYTLAYLYLLEYSFAEKFLGKSDQLQALRKLLLFEGKVEEKNQLLDAATMKSIRMNILQLLIQLGFYGEARNEFYWLNKELPDAAKPFESAMSQVYEKLKQGGVIARPIEIPDRGYDFHYLTKRSFEIDVAAGQIEKLNFYCTQKFGTMSFIPASNYQVPEDWGSCNVQIVGEPKTKATLYQQ